MSNMYCTTYSCGRQAYEKQNGKPYCQACSSQYERGVAAAAGDILKEVSVLRNKIVSIGIGGKDE